MSFRFFLLLPLFFFVTLAFAPTIRIVKLAPVTPCQAVSRRDVLEQGTTSAWLLASQPTKTTGPQQKAPPPTSSSSSTGLVADLPMIRLALPPSGLGREYLAIPLMIQGQGPFEFMVDTGLTTELITPHLQEILGLGKQQKTNKGRQVQGIVAGGLTTNTLIDLKDVSLTNGYALPTLHAVVTDFPQEHLDPKHDPIEGMIGMEALSLFDVELDFPHNRVRLYQPGMANTQGLVEIPAAVINDTGLLGIRVTAAAKDNKGAQQQQQPIIGVLDCGATFSAVNWPATRYLGLPTNPEDPKYRQGPFVAAVGVNGQSITMPTIKSRLTFAGNLLLDPQTQQPTGFATPPADFEPWELVPIAVGNVPALSNALGDGVTPFQGPAALIGLDILSQRRIILESARPGDTNRQRRVWVSAK